MNFFQSLVGHKSFLFTLETGPFLGALQDDLFLTVVDIANYKGNELPDAVTGYITELLKDDVRDISGPYGELLLSTIQSLLLKDGSIVTVDSDPFYPVKENLDKIDKILTAIVFDNDWTMPGILLCKDTSVPEAQRIIQAFKSH